MSETFDSREEVGHGREADYSFAKGCPGNHFGFEIRMATRGVIGRLFFGLGNAKVELLSDSDFSAGPNQTLPFIGIVAELVG